MSFGNFLSAASEGDVERLQSIANALEVPKTCAITALGDACEYGRIDAMHWLATRYGITKSDLHCDCTDPTNVFRHACIWGNFDAIKWLTEYFHIRPWDVVAYIRAGLRDVICMGAATVPELDWFVREFDVKGADLRYCQYAAFVCALRRRDHAVAEWMIGKFGLTKEFLQHEGISLAYVLVMFWAVPADWAWFVEKYQVTYDDIGGDANFDGLLARAGDDPEKMNWLKNLKAGEKITTDK